LAQSTALNGACLYLGSLAPTISLTGRNWSWAVVPTAAITSSGLGTLGIDTTMLPPSTLTSDSATPLELTRLRMMSTVVSSCSVVGAPPRGLVGTKVTVDPPFRSRPSRGLMPWTMITPQTAPTSRNTISRGIT
jgi:hypothetical protein